MAIIYYTVVLCSITVTFVWWAQLTDYSGGSSSWEGDERCIGSQSLVLASNKRQDNSKCHNFTYIRRVLVKLWPLG